MTKEENLKYVEEELDKILSDSKENREFKKKILQTVSQEISDGNEVEILNVDGGIKIEVSKKMNVESDELTEEDLFSKEVCDGFVQFAKEKDFITKHTTITDDMIKIFIGIVSLLEQMYDKERWISAFNSAFKDIANVAKQDYMLQVIKK